MTYIISVYVRGSKAMWVGVRGQGSRVEVKGWSSRAMAAMGMTLWQRLAALSRASMTRWVELVECPSSYDWASSNDTISSNDTVNDLPYGCCNETGYDCGLWALTGTDCLQPMSPAQQQWLLSTTGYGYDHWYQLWSQAMTTGAMTGWQWAPPGDDRLSAATTAGTDPLAIPSGYYTSYWLWSIGYDRLAMTTHLSSFPTWMALSSDGSTNLPCLSVYCVCYLCMLCETSVRRMILNRCIVPYHILGLCPLSRVCWGHFLCRAWRRGYFLFIVQWWWPLSCMGGGYVCSMQWPHLEAMTGYDWLTMAIGLGQIGLKEIGHKKWIGSNKVIGIK